MNYAVLGLVILTSVIATGQQKGYLTAGQLNEMCIASTRMTAAKDSNNIAVSDMTKGPVCIGYIEGVIDTAILDGLKVSDDVTVGQAIEIFESAMADHPEYLNENAPSVVGAALVQKGVAKLPSDDTENAGAAIPRYTIPLPVAPAPVVAPPSTPGFYQPWGKSPPKTVCHQQMVYPARLPCPIVGGVEQPCQQPQPYSVGTVCTTE